MTYLPTDYYFNEQAQYNYTERVCLVKTAIIIISANCNLSRHDIAVELLMFTLYNSLPFCIAPKYQHLIYFGFMLWSFYVDVMFFFMLNFITLKFIKQESHWYTNMLFASPLRLWCSFIATYRSWPISRTYQKQQLHPRQDCLRLIACYFDPI